MLHTVFLIKLLLVGCTTQSPTQIEAKCNEDISLKCRDEDGDIVHMDFLSVTWYKLNPRVGIIRKGKGDPRGLPYVANSTAKIEENYNLLLRSVTPEDSGTYDCDVSANIGSQNRNFITNLVVHECVAEPTTAKTMSNMTNTSSCSTQVEELPVMWSIICYVAVSFVKITLCVISIWSRISQEETSGFTWSEGEVFICTTVF